MTLLRDLMLADLERGLAIARDGHEVVPAWRVLAPDGDFLKGEIIIAALPSIGEASRLLPAGSKRDD